SPRLAVGDFAGQRDFTILYFHVDVGGIEIRIAHQRFVHVFLDARVAALVVLRAAPGEVRARAALAIVVPATPAAVAHEVGLVAERAAVAVHRRIGRLPQTAGAEAGAVPAADEIVRPKVRRAEVARSHHAAVAHSSTAEVAAAVAAVRFGIIV